MLIFQRHIFKNLFSLFLLTCFVCTGIVWLTQALKLVYLVTKGVSIFTFLELSFLTLPAMLLTIIPISCVLSVLYYYSKIKNDREMVVMENSGLNYIQIAKPAILMSFILAIVCYSISLYLLPFSYNKLKTKLETLKSSYMTSILHPKTFNPVSKNVTLYFDKRFRNGTLTDLIVFDYREKYQPAIIYSKRGKIIFKPENMAFHLVDGVRQNPGIDGFIDIMQFNDLIVNINTVQHNFDRKNKDIQELYLTELFSPKGEESLFRVSKFRAEGHQRLVWPIFNIALAIVALACIIPYSYNRRGNFRPIFYAASIAVVIVILNFIFSNLSIKKPWLDYFIYLNLIITIMVSYYRLVV